MGIKDTHEGLIENIGEEDNDELARVSVKFAQDDLDFMDGLVKRKKYVSRSEIIRRGVQELRERIEMKKR